MRRAGAALVQRMALAFVAVSQSSAAAPATPAAALVATPVKGDARVEAKVEQVRKARAESLLGQPVTDAMGDVFGHVVDVLIDQDGTPHAAVIESSGFFGIGNREMAVDWKALTFSVQQDRIAISVRLDPDKLRAMPEYKSEAPSVPVATQAAPATRAPIPPAPPRPH